MQSYKMSCIYKECYNNRMHCINKEKIKNSSIISNPAEKGVQYFVIIPLKIKCILLSVLHCK